MTSSTEKCVNPECAFYGQVQPWRGRRPEEPAGPDEPNQPGPKKAKEETS